MKFSLTACLVTALYLANPVAAQADQPDGGYYSWIILAGILVMLILLGVIIQLRKPKQKEAKEEPANPETVD